VHILTGGLVGGIHALRCARVALVDARHARVWQTTRLDPAASRRMPHLWCLRLLSMLRRRLSRVAVSLLLWCLPWRRPHLIGRWVAVRALWLR
jgi:hypothetical protein